MGVTHRSLSVAVESSFGSLSTSTGLPDASGLSYVSLPCERDPIIIYGDAVVSDKNKARGGRLAPRWLTWIAARIGHALCLGA